MNITFENIDLSNEASIEHAIDSLRAYARLPRNVIRGMANVTVTFPSDEVTTVASDNPLGHYGNATRGFLEVMLGLIDKNGTTSLEEAATEAGVSLDTARAYLRNAGRTAAAHGLVLPVTPKWNTGTGANDYTRSENAA